MTVLTSVETGRVEALPPAYVGRYLGICRFGFGEMWTGSRLRDPAQLRARNSRPTSESHRPGTRTLRDAIVMSFWVVATYKMKTLACNRKRTDDRKFVCRFICEPRACL